ncbi:MAG: amino acid deaminase [Proteobacteria bacterium]|jgi:D-serine dehydratase|nr:amino acid deaminase [Pseudomonadota bacterium]
MKNNEILAPALPADKGVYQINTRGEKALILNGDISFPSAVLYRSRLEHNIEWMQKFANKAGVSLAPHGKASMMPALFQEQIMAGAWGMTMGTSHQVAVAVSAGIKRILMANQLVGYANMTIISDLIETIEYFCLVDNVDNIRQLDDFFTLKNQQLNVLIEYGMVGGRCGCRSQEDLIAVRDAIKSSTSLKLAGIEVYEGLIHGADAEERITSLLNEVVDTFTAFDKEGFFDRKPALLTGAGSEWYDIVADVFSEACQNGAMLPIIRPGSYVIYDKGVYEVSQNKLMKRSEMARSIGSDLQSALEIWACVQSVPEPGFAVVGMGKRDVAFHAGLPQPRLYHRPDRDSGPDKPSPVVLESGWETLDVMDLHTLVRFPKDIGLKPGDILAFSTSHPNLTLDKWRSVCIIDDDYRVIDTMQTFC